LQNYLFATVEDQAKAFGRLETCIDFQYSGRVKRRYKLHEGDKIKGVKKILAESR
jgi:hypothetical protein